MDVTIPLERNDHNKPQGTRTPGMIDAVADWWQKKSEYHQRRGFVHTAEIETGIADHYFMEAYYLRKYGTVNPWA